MKTYPLYLNEAQLRLVLDLLNSAVDDIAVQIATLLNSAQSEPEPPPFPPPEPREKKPRKPAPVTRREAIERLGERHPEAAKAVVAWKNKADGVLGWDRWLRANHPAAAAELWPSLTKLAVSAKRAGAFVQRIKPVRSA